METTKQSDAELQASNAKVQGILNFVSEPGAVVIEAIADAEGQGNEKPRLPRFSMVAYTGGPMRINGWRYPVIVDLAGLAIPSQNRPIRFGHDMQSGVGHTDAIQVENGRLTAAGVVSRDTAAAKEIVVSAKNGFPWQASIGTSVDEFEFVKENQKVSVNGREFLGPVNVVRKSMLGEISFVDLGADGQTSAQVAAAAPNNFQEKTIMPETVTTTSTENNQPADSPAAAPQAITASALAEPTVKTAPTVAEVRAGALEALAENNRIADIRRICAGKFSNIEAQAIRDGWDATRCELEVLRCRPPNCTSRARA